MNHLTERIAVGILGLLLAGRPVAAQAPRNFVQQVFGRSEAATAPMLGGNAPGFTLLIASQELKVERTARPDVVTLGLDGIPSRFEMHHEQWAGIDQYRIRQAPGSPLRGEHIRFTWDFPESYNESMTFDTGALQGQPLHLPDGKVPDNQFTNWGSLFYDRAANLAVGVQLDGAEGSRHARRGYSRFTKKALLQLMAITGNPKMEIIIFAYHPKDARFWWAEWYQARSGIDPDMPANFFPILSARDIGWRPGDSQTVNVIPAPADQGRRMDLVLIDDIHHTVVSRVPFRYTLPVTNVTVPVGDWASSVYRLIVVPAGERVDPAENDLNRKLTNVIVRPRAPAAPVLFVFPTDTWWAYATNGSHDYHGWRTGYDGSVGYAPTVMSSRQHRLNNFFYALYERFTDIDHVRYLDQLAKQDGFSIDFASQQDVARGRVRLSDYSLVMIGNHSEFTTEESFRRVREYLGQGGSVMIHGGDSFAVRVEILPNLDDPRYLWQRGHVWTHLSDQASDFLGPVLLPPDAAASAPILNPTAGKAIDYVNVFHTSVSYWIPGAKAVIADTAHPIVRGLKLSMGQEVPGPWGGEVDIPYEPQAWDVLIRSDSAAPDEREFGVDAYDPTPFHRVGLAIHRNLRLGLVSGENFPLILNDSRNTLFRELYRRTLHYLLDGARPFDPAANLVSAAQRNATVITWDHPVRLDALRYELPEFVDFSNPDWHRAAQPYAHYVIEGSIDGQHWTTLADRRHGPWRGPQTDTFAATEVRFLRFDGTLSNGQLFRLSNVQAYPAR